MTRPLSVRPVSTSYPRRGIKVSLALGGLAVLITGCGAGQNALSTKRYNVADGLQASKGDVRVLNALVVAGTKPGAAGGTVSFTIANTGNTATQQLTGIDVAGAPATLSGQSGDIAPAATLRVGAGGTVNVLLPTQKVVAGTYVPLVVHFGGELGDIAMNATVVAPTDYYSTLSPSPVPVQPSAQATEAPSEAATAS